MDNILFIRQLMAEIGVGLGTGGGGGGQNCFLNVTLVLSYRRQSEFLREGVGGKLAARQR